MTVKLSREGAAELVDDWTRPSPPAGLRKRDRITTENVAEIEADFQRTIEKLGL